MKETTWITAREAARRLEVHVNVFLAHAGKFWDIRHRDLPNFPTRWHAGDVAKMATSTVKSGPRPKVVE